MIVLYVDIYGGKYSRRIINRFGWFYAVDEANKFVDKLKKLHNQLPECKKYIYKIIGHDLRKF